MSTRRSGPIWAQPAPGSRRPRFTREQIAEIALRISDEEGFEALSMRRIAEELGAGTMTLYHYVRTKEDLIALMDDAIMAEVLLPPSAIGTDWQASLAAIARSSYRAFQRHPWAFTALSGARFGPNSMKHIEQSLAAVAHAPFDEQGKLDAIGIADDYVLGHVTRVMEMSKHDELSGGEPTATLVAFTRAQLATGEFPNLEALTDGDLESSWERIARKMSHEDRFERGLRALLEGIARTFTRGEPRAPARTRAPARRAGRRKRT